MKNQKVKWVVITGGGTGGHVYPALPVIRLLQKEDYKIHWIGSRKGIERGLVQGWGLPYTSISTGKLRRYFSLRNFTDVFRILWGCIQSFFFLLRIRPVLVFSKGGFVSVPPVLAAALLKIPVLTHDSDVDPGLATRINSRFSKEIFVAYERSLSYYASAMRPKVLVSGNPVRQEFFDRNRTLPEEWLRKIGGRRLLVVIGGSLGARQLNELVQNSLPDLTRDFFVIHQMGEKNYTPSDREYYLPLPYIEEELPALFQRADLAVSRAGAGTLWELACASTPAVLLPLTQGTRGDQIKNASVFQEAGAAEVLPDDPAAGDLIRLVRGILENPDKLSSMKEAAGGFLETPAEDIILAGIRRREKV